MVAEIIINSNVKNLNKTFDYLIPKNLEEKISVGVRVFVPFGNKKKLEEGFVVGIKEETETNFKLKEIQKIEYKQVLEQEKIELAKWIANRYFCNIADGIKLMLPPGTTTKNIQNRVNDKKQKFVNLIKEPEEIEKEIENKKIKSDKQIRVLRFLIKNIYENNKSNMQNISTTDLQMLSDVTNAVLKTLEKNKYIQIIEKEVQRNPFLHKVIQKSENLKLTQEQQDAFEKVNASMQIGEYEEFLLFGVTGSRKNRNIYTTNRRSYKIR